MCAYGNRIAITKCNEYLSGLHLNDIETESLRDSLYVLCDEIVRTYFSSKLANF